MSLNPEQLKRKLDYANKRLKFAWARYYSEVHGHNQNDYIQYVFYRKTIQTENAGIPVHIKNEMNEMAEKLKKQWECPVCLDFISHEDLEITNCGHFYCKECLETWKKTQKDNGHDKWKCGVCNRKHNFNDQ